MAAVAVSALTTTPVAAPSGLKKSTFSGAAVQGLPVLRTSKAPGSLRVEASTKKIVTKEPLGEKHAMPIHTCEVSLFHEMDVSL
jgi:photosystem II protein